MSGRTKNAVRKKREQEEGSNKKRTTPSNDQNLKYLVNKQTNNGNNGSNENNKEDELTGPENNQHEVHKNKSKVSTTLETKKTFLT